MTRLSIVLALLVVCSGTQLLAQPASGSSKASDPQKIAAALQKAAELLVSNQENYEADRPVGRLSEERLPEWQKEEKKRLSGVREKSAASGAREWPYEGVYRVRPDGRIPSGYRVGGTAITSKALVLTPGYADDPNRVAAVERGIAFILDTLRKDPTMAIDAPINTYDVRGWGHAYALDLFAWLKIAKVKVDPKLQRRIDRTIPWLMKALAVNETRAGTQRAGGWNYANPRSHSSFMTASTILTLHRCRQAGMKVDQGLIDRGLRALQTGQSDENGAFGYSGARKEEMGSSVARAGMGELVLMLNGKSDAKKLKRGIDGFFDNYEWLLKRKSQQGTHVRPYGIAPYYFFWGHTYTALAIEYLPESERAAYRERLMTLLWEAQDANGGFNDRIFPRTESYSTAMAMLAMLAPDLARFPEAATTKKR